jgi:hypothetical protein
MSPIVQRKEAVNKSAPIAGKAKMTGWNTGYCIRAESVYAENWEAKMTGCNTGYCIRAEDVYAKKMDTH